MPHRPWKSDKMRPVGRGIRSQTSTSVAGSRYDGLSSWEGCTLHHLAEYLKPRLQEDKIVRFSAALRRHADFVRIHMGTPAIYEPIWKLIDALLSANLRLAMHNSRAVLLFERRPLSCSGTFWMLKGMTTESFKRDMECILTSLSDLVHDAESSHDIVIRDCFLECEVCATTLAEYLYPYDG